MIYRTNREDIRAYFDNSDRVSQSQLKLLLQDPNMFKEVSTEDEYEEKEHFLIGSGVDTLITEGEDVFNEMYYLSTLSKPSDTIMKIVKRVFEELNFEDGEDGEIAELRLSDLSDFIVVSCEYFDYQRRWTNDTKIKKVVEEGSDYYQELIESNGKTILSIEQHGKIQSIVEFLTVHPYTSSIFQDSNYKDILYQYPVYFTYKGVECKGLLDMVVIDYLNKTIEVFDIKTMGDYTLKFPVALKRRRYDIQAAFYLQGLIQMRTQIESLVGVSTLGFKLKGFSFVVESTIKPGQPLVFTCTKELIKTGKHGIPGGDIRVYHIEIGEDDVPYYDMHKSKFYPVYGFDKAIENYKWYLENGFDTHRDIVENDGKFEIDWYGIKNTVNE